MKKNAMLKIAAILLVAVLLTTCAISSTFAKYVTEGTGDTTTANVAKWGVKISSSLEGLFAENYDSDTDGYDDDTVVSATSGVLVLAPGTEGSASATTTLSGKPEVAFEITTDATVSLGGDWEDDKGAFYCPVVFTINGQKVQAAEGDDAASFAGKIETEIEKATNKFAAGTTLANNTVPVAISWAWAIGNASAADTQLGDIAAGIVEDKDIPSITIEFNQTATQLD